MPTDATAIATLRSGSSAGSRSSEPADDAHGIVVLDRTVFYPGGGGQPSDSGWLTARRHDAGSRSARRRRAGHRPRSRARDGLPAAARPSRPRSTGSGATC